MVTRSFHAEALPVPPLLDHFRRLGIAGVTPEMTTPLAQKALQGFGAQRFWL
ncbi:MAG TPA: hypothetical protein VNP04_12745 [Alphaproteobacteria bacterium]|nr:hypothetical protein [Alphaproteobacteria bacterium]